ncbi:hypothetical protein C3F09_11185 [candidate division GN15 bacterium]|uniref:Flagellar Assembly Protein A N-terminal region domain-containing protein n=1 Tax=candidate division GN15 bacterium TaxID=2072418 RepID=A0A855WVS6_9BACT|nr:MAG: hypothetical protein C3F09_11185 [candidate division GN15 bacterium]
MAGETAQTGTQHKARVTITKDGMHAMLVIYPPSPGEASPTLADIALALDKVGVIYGIDQDLIGKSLRENAYNTPIPAAVGNPPKKGQDSVHTYTFDINNNHSPHEDADGRIDYKQLNFLQSAEIGQVLATRSVPTEGTSGTNVMGKPIPAATGRDVPFRAGSGTKVSEDGRTLSATVTGAICYRNGEVSVKDIVSINQDVDTATGNLDCRGSVRIRGDVKTGFTVMADGDVEVSGAAEDCTIKARGSILIKGGFFGGGNGLLQADGNITVKFAEGQKLVAGGDLTVGGELVHCSVIVRGNVTVKGKHGKIVGGEIRAGREIHTSIAGSEAATPTVLYVGYNTELMSRYYAVQKELNRLKGDSARIKDALYGLYRLQMDGKLTKEKLAVLQKLETFQKDLPQNLSTLESQKVEIESKLSEFRDAKIIIDDVLYPGVKAYFGLVYREILEEVRACKLTLDGSQVLMSAVHRTESH